MASSVIEESPIAATRPVPYVDVAKVTPLDVSWVDVVFQTWPFAAPLSVIDDEPNRPRPRVDEGTPNVPAQMIGEVVSVVKLPSG